MWEAKGRKNQVFIVYEDQENYFNTMQQEILFLKQTLFALGHGVYAKVAWKLFP